ncbi:MAG: hypothetical protein LBN22_09030 [Clostridiales Family XIII bacterium]|jgi:hypothetical protein|nr:hypothetical protein [Clostridiales Family XIII bacterium]
MNNFVKINWFYTLTAITETLNGFFYFLRKLPVIGTKIPTSLYKSKDIKLAFMIFVGIGKFVMQAGLKLIIVAIAYILSVCIIHQNLSFELFVNGSTAPDAVMAVIMLIVAMVLLPRIMELFYGSPDKKMLAYISHFQLSYTKTVRSLSIFKEIKTLFLYVLPVLLFGWISGVGAFKLALVYILMRLFCFVSFEMLGRKVDVEPIKEPLKGILWAIFSLLAIAIVVVMYRFDLANVAISLPVMLVLAVLTILLGFLFFTYKSESRYIERLITVGNVRLEKTAAAVGNSQNKYLAEGVAMQKHISLGGERKFDHLKGSSLLNALLFYRYKKTLNKSIKIRLGAFALALFICAALNYFVPNVGAYTVSESKFLKLLPGVVFLLYLIGYGKKIVQMCFVNCDVAMLHYPFYRESKTILSGFDQRFKKIFSLNTINALCVFALLLTICLFWGEGISMNFYVVMILFLVAVTLLLSFHELFIYYLLQPFASNMAVANPLYKIITFVFYLLCYATAQLHIKGYWFVLGISIVSLLYVGIGSIVIKNRAPKTFRFKD